MAQALAARLERGGGATSAPHGDQAYEIAFQREPTTEERAVAVPLIATHGWAAFWRVLLNMNALIDLD